MRLNGKSVLLTGGGSGLGKALALAMAARGARVAIVGRREEALSRTVSESTGDHPIVPIPLDLLEYRNLPVALEIARSALGPLDVLVNNAGVGYGGDFEGISTAELEHEITLNLLVPMWLTRLALGELRSRPEALIVYVASLSGLTPMPFQASYCASKFGLAGFGASLAFELEKTNVRVLSVFPGAMDTELNTPRLRECMKANGVKFDCLDPREAADQILDAIRRDAERVVPAPGSQSWIPGLVRWCPAVLRAQLRKAAPTVREFMTLANEWVRSRTPLKSLDERDE